MIRYEDFTLALSTDGKEIEVWTSPAGRASAVFVPPQLDSILELESPASLSYRTVYRRFQAASAEQELQALGRQLFASLFPQPIADLLQQSLTRAEASDGRFGVRIRLVLRWPAHLRHLQALPWETLHCSPPDQFLARQPLTTLVRTPLAPGHLTARPGIEPPLRILLMLSQPEDTIRLALDEERGQISEAFARAASFHDLPPPQLKVLTAPVTAEVFEAALRENFHVVHFAGHGDFDDSGIGTLHLENEDRSIRPFDGKALAEHLKLCPSLRLVVLNACWSALPGEDGRGEPDLGVGTALAELGVPAVIAMQRPIADDAAADFAGNLYAQLALGDPLELAICHSRVKLADKYPKSPSWAIPVLLMGAEHGEIVVPPGQPAGANSAVSRHVRNVRALIAEKTRHFVGRKFLFDLVKNELADRAGCILLMAEPGFGKTAFLAQWVRKNRHVHHFNRLASADSNQTEHFLANIIAQLIQRYELPYPVLPVQALRDASFFLSICEEAVKKLKRGEMLVLVVDALDEVDRQNEPLTRNPLDLPEALPDRCALLLTSRPQDAPLRYQGKFFKKELLADTAENTADLIEYIRRALGRGRTPEFRQKFGYSEEKLTEELLAHSAGNFMYLRYVLGDLESGRFDGDFKTLPHGLDNYYQQQWQRLRRESGDAFFDLAVPTLAALTDLRAPISVGLIAKLIGRPQEGPRIASLLRSLRQFLKIENLPEEPQRKTYQLYHGSFHDFITMQPEVAEQEIGAQTTRFFRPRRPRPRGGP